EDEIGDLMPVILSELEKASRDITEEEVSRVRAQIRAGLLMSLESPSSRAGQLARQQILWGRPIPPQETVDRINRIDAERVRHVAGQIFGSAKPVVAGIGRRGRRPDYAHILDRFKCGRRDPVFAFASLRPPAPEIQGEGLLPRSPRQSDYAAWRALRLSSRAFLAPFEPRWSEADLSARNFAARVRRNRRDALYGTEFSLFIFNRDGRHSTLVGGMTLSNVRR